MQDDVTEMHLTTETGMQDDVTEIQPTTDDDDDWGLRASQR